MRTLGANVRQFDSSRGYELECFVDILDFLDAYPRHFVVSS